FLCGERSDAQSLRACDPVATRRRLARVQRKARHTIVRSRRKTDRGARNFADPSDDHAQRDRRICSGRSRTMIVLDAAGMRALDAREATGRTDVTLMREAGAAIAALVPRYAR